MAQLVGALSRALKGCGFGSRSCTWVAGWIPGPGVYGRQPIDVSLSLPPSLPLSLKAMKKMFSGEDKK